MAGFDEGYCIIRSDNDGVSIICCSMKGVIEEGDGR